MLFRSMLISDLSGMEAMVGLTSLGLQCNKIIDISPLANLTGLTFLELDFNRIRDVTPLGNLTMLERLHISDNDFHLTSNLAALKSLTNAVTIYMPSWTSPGNTGMSCAELQDLTNTLGANVVSPTALVGVTCSDPVPVANVVIPDASLQACVNYAFQNIGAVHAHDLSDLVCYFTLISNLSGIEALTGLNWLSVVISGVSDVTPLRNLTGLTSLNLRSSAITDVTALGNLTGLTRLDLAYNNISSGVAALGNLPNLTHLDLTSNNISGVVTALGNLTSLNYLSLVSNSLQGTSNISALSSLTNTSTLALDNNVGISCTELQGLISLGLPVSPNVATNGVTCTNP